MQIRIPSLLIMLVVIAFSMPHTQAQSIALNEIMSSNSQVIADEDGEFPDWI